MIDPHLKAWGSRVTAEELSVALNGFARTPLRLITETVADYWMPGLAICWRVTIRAEAVWPRMISDRVH